MLLLLLVPSQFSSTTNLLLKLRLFPRLVIHLVLFTGHGVVVVVDHVVGERASNGFLADGLDVRQSLADQRALQERKGLGSGGDQLTCFGRERPEFANAYLALELLLHACQRRGFVMHHG